MHSADARKKGHWGQAGGSGLMVLTKRGSPLYKLFGAGWGKKGVGGFFFKTPTTQLRVVWGLTEKKCEQTPKFACFSV